MSTPPAMLSGPDHFWPRITEFVWGEEGIIVANTGAEVWPAQAYRLKYQAPDSFDWKINRPGQNDRVAGISLLDWRADQTIFGKRYVLWAGEPQRNFSPPQATYPRVSFIWVNHVRCSTPANCYGGALFIPTFGDFEGQTLVIAVVIGTGAFIPYYCTLGDFLSSSGTPTWTAMTGTFGHGGSLVSNVRSVFFANDGSKAAWIDSNGDTFGRENTSYEVEMFIGETGTTFTTATTSHGPFDINTRIQGHDNAGFTTVYAALCGPITHPVGPDSPTSDLEEATRDRNITFDIDCDALVPVGVDYQGTTKKFVYVRTRVNVTVVSTMVADYNHDLSPPSPLTPVDVHVTSPWVYTATQVETSVISGGISGKLGMVKNLIVGDKDFGIVAWTDFQSNTTTTTVSTVEGFYYATEDDCFLPVISDPGTPPYIWAEARDRIVTDTDINTVGTSVAQENIDLCPIFADARYETAVIETLNYRGDGLTAKHTLSTAYDDNDAHEMDFAFGTSPISPAVLPQEACIFQGYFEEAFDDTGGGVRDDSFTYTLIYNDNAADYEQRVHHRLSTAQRPADVAITHFNHGLVVILSGADGVPERTFMSGSGGQTIAVDLPDLVLTQPMMSWATPT